MQAGLVAVMDGTEVGPFNLGNPTEFTMLELANLVKEVVNPKAEIIYKENTPDDPSRRKPDITKVKSHMFLCIHCTILGKAADLKVARQ